MLFDMSTALLPDTAHKAKRLVAASERATYDPFTTIDWSQPIDDTAYHLPPEALPLYGSPIWDAMTEPERIAYSRHELASLCSAGIWFEGILMHLVLRHLYDMPADDPSHRYLLIETADECRHSAMFGEVIRQAGTPAYRVRPLLRLSGRLLKASAGRAAGYIAILAAEELLDVANRATMKDERVHPISKSVAKLHVLEEARHMSFARTYLTEVWPTLKRRERIVASLLAPAYVWGIADALVNPAVYEELGIDGGARVARRNPFHRRRITRDLSRLTEYLEGLGVIGRFTKPMWRLLGLAGGEK
jgi:hypothetical protein